MDKAIPLAFAASFCTAASSVCQRLAASSAQADGFDPWLVFRLARRPVWLVGVAGMILGFAFQLAALRFGALAFVQPILAMELLLVFGCMAVLGPRRVRPRDWLAASAMAGGLGLFLLAAAPSAAGRTRRACCGGWPGWRPALLCSWGWPRPPGWAAAGLPRDRGARRRSGPPPGLPGVSWPR